ncbi:MAG: winged helix-turn-helix domain-containing protein [Faecousia sp.]
MEVIIYREPCWLLEAAELVYGLVNNIPAEKLTRSGLYCIPAEDVARIQRSACAGIDPEDEPVQYYFRGVALEGFSGRLSCLGCSLLYTHLAIEHPRLEDYCQAVLLEWNESRAAGLRVNGIDGFSLSFESAEGGKTISLSKELLELHVPALYRMQLLEVFSAFEEHLSRVAELLRPVVARLPGLMEPWTCRIPALAQQWEDFFREHPAQEFFLHRARVKDTGYQKLEMAFRFFSPAASPGKYSEDCKCLRFHMGVSMQPGIEAPSAAYAPEEWELTAMRLMANSARVEMLRLMTERPMSGPELAQRLNLNPGSVFRDLNSLYNARLLLAESVNGSGRNYYRTNVSVVRQITAHMASYIQNDVSGE